MDKDSYDIVRQAALEKANELADPSPDVKIWSSAQDIAFMRVRARRIYSAITHLDGQHV